MQNAGLAPPTFESNRAGNAFSLILLFHHLLGGEDVEWLARFRQHYLTADECQALVYARELGAISNRALRNLSGAETLAASRTLRRLRDEGLLDQKGKGSATYYVPSAYLQEERGEESAKPMQVAAARSEEVPAKPSEVGQKPREVGTNPSEVEGLEVEDEGSLMEEWGPIGDRLRSLPKNLRAIPPAILLKVEGLGKSARKEKLRAAIIELCEWRPLRAEEIARILGRNQTYLVENQLSPMIAEGSLKYTIPEEPHHMRQAYKAAQDTEP